MKNIITKIIIVFIIFFIGFYLYKNNLPKYTPLPQQYLEDRETFGRVNQLFNDAMGMTQAPDNSGKPFDIPKDQLYYPIESRKIEIDTPISNLSSFAKENGINYKILKLHNPWLRDKKLENKSKKVYILAIPTEGY